MTAEVVPPREKAAGPQDGTNPHAKEQQQKQQPEPEPVFAAELTLDDPYKVQTSVLFKDDDFKLNTPYWEQSLLSSRVEYSVGRLSSRSIYGDKSRYLNKTFSSTAAIPLPEEGFGAYGAVKTGAGLSFSASIHEANAEADRWSADFLERGAYFSTFGIDYSPSWAESGSEIYKLSLWRREVSDEAKNSSGLALQYEKHYGETLSWSPFLRFSYRQKGTLETSTLATAGLNIGRLPGSRDNSIGIAYAQEQTDFAGQAAHTFEMYYRMHLKPYLELTPDIQHIYQPIDQPALERITVSRLNLRLLF